jgi:ketosteroid isomerase-like protein
LVSALLLGVQRGRRSGYSLGNRAPTGQAFRHFILANYFLDRVIELSVRQSWTDPERSLRAPRTMNANANSTPMDTVNQLIEARSRGDVDTAASCYEAGATVVAMPGTVVSGAEAVRAVLTRFASLKGDFRRGRHQLIEAGDMAFYCSDWSMIAIDPHGKPIRMEGRTADVLRRQADGRWLVVFDNPWGTAILG